MKNGLHLFNTLYLTLSLMKEAIIEIWLNFVNNISQPLWYTVQGILQVLIEEHLNLVFYKVRQMEHALQYLYVGPFLVKGISDMFTNTHLKDNFTGIDMNPKERYSTY